jgi:hypothetical protein
MAVVRKGFVIQSWVLSFSQVLESISTTHKGGRRGEMVFPNLMSLCRGILQLTLNMADYSAFIMKYRIFSNLIRTRFPVAEG